MLEQVVAIAEAAAARVMDVYAGEVTAAGKADGTPLTAADLAAHETIVAGLRALPASFPVLSEEGTALPYEVRRGWETFWLVDPLDGTKEFLNRNGEFTVNIALVRDGRPALGVVCAPALDVVYWAAHGQGAFVRHGANAPAERLAVSQRTGTGRENGPLRVVASRSHAGEEMPRLLERLGPHQTVMMGSSLKICLVAAGKADLYPRLGPTSEWDIAAAHCILDEAGGLLTGIDGAPFLYNKEEILNPSFLAAASVRVQRLALDALATV